MYRILNKKQLAPEIYRFTIAAPVIAAKAQPGQFIMLRLDDKGERIPLTIHDFDAEMGTIKIVFQEVGLTTKCLAGINEGEYIQDIAGPLGIPSEIKNYGRVITVGGGVGTAPVYPIARALKYAGNEVISIIGARSEKYRILKQEMDEVSDKLLLCTDDGSSGEKGFVTDLLGRELAKLTPDLVLAIGPLPMMKAVSELTRDKQVTTLVSLNPIMVDGTGMCGACRVRIGEETKFACVEGPEFDGHLVDWEMLFRRAGMYRQEEENARQNGCCLGGGCL